MPTLPLFDRLATPGDWHAVAAPGGYEAWAFDAEDASTDTQVTVAFTTGAQQRTEYLKQYAAFRRSPTTTPPPSPVDYAGVVVCVYRAGKLVRRSFTPGEVKVADPAMDVSIGTARLWRSNDHWKLAADGVELVFTPAVPAAAGRPVLKFLRRLHEWTPLAPRCSVTGSIDGAGFTGVGSVEHAFGEAPVCFGLARLIRGRIFTADASMLFHLAKHKVASRPEQATLLRVSSAGVAESDEATIDGPYADAIRFGEHLTLTQPRIIDAHARGVRVIYDAELHGTRGTAHCDVFYPQPPRRTFNKVLMDWLVGVE